MEQDTATLLAEFDAEKRIDLQQCKACTCGYTEFIDILFERGAGATVISEFLHHRLKIDIAESSLRRHRRKHAAHEDA